MYLHFPRLCQSRLKQGKRKKDKYKIEECVLLREVQYYRQLLT